VRFAIRVIAGSAGQDRAAVFEPGSGLVVALADGAGGMGGGAEAATAVIEAARAATHADWGELLVELDGIPQSGQTTAIVLSIDDRGIRGASVGDSAACLVRGGALVELTRGQSRKPLLFGGASPHGFAHGPLAGATLVVASDGLWNYAPRPAIAELAAGDDLEAAADALVDLVRLPSGELQDDVAIVLVR
jgi:serine/threonine protein phosphatase PrpC